MALAAGHIADELRGACPFSYGDTIAHGRIVAEGSKLTDFVVFAPISLDEDAFLGIDVGDDLPVSIAGLYPIHESERRFVDEHGLEPFWQLDWDPYDVARPPVA